MKIPESLAEALAHETALSASKHSSAGVREIQRRYRAGASAESGGMLRSESDVALYAAFRFPSTFAALRRVFEEVKSRMPEFSPASLLDAGAGPGSALLAAMEVWPGVSSALLVEKNGAMISLGQRLLEAAHPDFREKAEWVRKDMAVFSTVGQFDLVVASYSLDEFDASRMEGVLNNLSRMTKGVFVIVEPSLNPDISLLVEKARLHFLDTGFYMLAPCPHGNSCGHREKDWCHFAQRLERTKVQRVLKGGSLPFEDEKFIYAVLSKTRGIQVKGVLTRHPVVRKGHIILEICSTDGLRTVTVGKSAKEAYKLAKKLSWGDAVRDDALGALLDKVAAK